MNLRSAIMVSWGLLVASCTPKPLSPTTEPETNLSATREDQRSRVADSDQQAASEPESFAAALALLKAHTDVKVLERGNARLAVVPLYQGRVMTSSAAGDEGRSYGWLNDKAIADGTRKPHMNVFGGEDRFWLGPEGGQYSIYFAPKTPFDLEHWQVPEPIDWGGWPIIDQREDMLHFRKEMRLTNYSGTQFRLRVDRTVRLLDPQVTVARWQDAASVVERSSEAKLGKDVDAVCYASENVITNTGATAWSKKTGLLSIWILSMYNPSPTTTVIIPFVPGPESELGPIVNDKYFGPVSQDRLFIAEGVLFFKGDGKQRGKIGIPRPRAKPSMASYDSAQRVLTVVDYSLPADAHDYVNSMWELQDKPYAGDVVNSYNDGPPAPGKPPLGPFYELESSSPAAALAPGQKQTHFHRTCHFEGPERLLDALCRRATGVSLATVKAAFTADRDDEAGAPRARATP